MPKIKCPHCGANNQDMTEKDRCWQCDTVLGAPASAVADESAAPTIPAQKQMEPTRPAPPPVPSSPQSRFPAAPVAIVIVLLLIVLAIVFFTMKK